MRFLCGHAAQALFAQCATRITTDAHTLADGIQLGREQFKPRPPLARFTRENGSNIFLGGLEEVFSWEMVYQQGPRSMRPQSRSDMNVTAPALKWCGEKGWLGLGRELAQVEWLGNGPEECYQDREAAAVVGCYKRSVKEMHVPYIMPGENGGRSGTRWVALRETGSAATPGLLIMPTLNTPPMQMNVSEYGMEQLDSATHNHHLVSEDSVHVHMDIAHMGVGGDDSWTPSCMPKYQIAGAQPYELAIRLRALVPELSLNVEDVFRTSL
ncbi:hypothetical protein CYMTET_39822 [Cymbomonas tetramitiformis]|uniref:beta-galactosidase n=1 Tax=Cymbomonas tetramitiformis TaxID=36881 RepID=A0AAE0C9B4_9CHLO|nr:hypothetical protein CYMTET_39822 [Cymbomonas tetramitiformis]